MIFFILSPELMDKNTPLKLSSLPSWHFNYHKLKTRRKNM
jgi:hypothetical protein